MFPHLLPIKGDLPSTHVDMGSFQLRQLTTPQSVIKEETNEHTITPTLWCIRLILQLSNLLLREDNGIRLFASNTHYLSIAVYIAPLFVTIPFDHLDKC